MRSLVLLVFLALLAPSAHAASFTVDSTTRTIETSKIRIRFALDCPERVTSLWYRPYSDATPVNSESLPWEFSGQMIGGLWNIQGPIFSQGTDAATQSWHVLSQSATQLVLRIESHSTWTGQPNPRVRTDYTFFADSSCYQVQRTAYFSQQAWNPISLQPYVLRIRAGLGPTLRWRDSTGVVRTAGYCGGGCVSSNWQRHWSQVQGSGFSSTIMTHPSNNLLSFMNDNDSNSAADWTGPYTASQAWTKDVTWTVLAHFSTTPGNDALEDAVYSWFAGLPTLAVPDTRGEALRLALAPNPAADHAEIAFTLPAAGDAELAIFDTAGRRVATLTSGTHAAGSQHARWNGTNAEGRRAPAGIYLVRLRAAQREVTRRLIWLQ